jgi:DNA adenine methylase
VILQAAPPPETIDVYLEPFLGGGAVYFGLQAAGHFRPAGRRAQPATVILGDADSDLIALYTAVRDDPDNLIRQTEDYIQAATHGPVGPRGYYEAERQRWNAGDRTPARHLYLRRAAWNGLWRTSQAGHLNTPWRRAPPAPVNDKQIYAAHRALNDPWVELVDWDFRAYDLAPELADPALRRRLFAYFDPPYLTGGFCAYTAAGWGEEDLRDLLTFTRTWHDDGAHVLLSHAWSPTYEALLAELWPCAATRTVMARRAINSDGAGRGPVREILAYGPRPVQSPRRSRRKAA